MKLNKYFFNYKLDLSDRPLAKFEKVQNFGHNTGFQDHETEFQMLLFLLLTITA